MYWTYITQWSQIKNPTQKYQPVNAVSHYSYDGCSISKLQNGAIPLIFLNTKIGSACFIRNLIGNILWENTNRVYNPRVLEQTASVAAINHG